MFFSAGVNHHDLAVMAVGADAPSPPEQAVGLAHVALKIGDSLETLREAQAMLEAHQVKIRGLRDHHVAAGCGKLEIGAPLDGVCRAAFAGIQHCAQPAQSVCRP